jgi:signal transduction histidine kinase
MQVIKVAILTGLAVALGSTHSSALAQKAESATPQEVIAKVREAVQFLHDKGQAGIREFNARNSRWVWKDSYVFVYDCQQNEMLAHPIRPDLEGKPVLQIRDNNNKPIFKELCAAGKKSRGGWVEYVWPKPGEGKLSRKISYALAADMPFEYGTQVAAGIYDDSITPDQLSKLLEEMSNPQKYPMAQ